jgi:GMP synthase-like glutamine amidotransferase
MDVAILETGKPPGDLAARFGRYPAMFAKLLGPGFATVSYDVAAGELPAEPEAHAAYLITGSPAGVYDPLPWIDPLKAFLLQAKGKAKLVGICFGHQLMAETFGGRVTKCERGWGAGLQRYELWRPAPWTDGPASVAVPVSHQDQVLEPPPQATILGGSAFTPFGLIAYDDQPAFSMQFHPEFEPDYARALIEFRRDRLPDPDGALASLDRPDDRGRVAGWIRAFLTG